MSRFTVQYQINDPHLYLYGFRVMRMKCWFRLPKVRSVEQVGRSDLNSVLNNRGPLSTASKERLQASLDAYRTGLLVTGLTLPDARPPEEGKSAFDEGEWCSAGT